MVNRNHVAKIDNITKERVEWRKELRRLIEELSKEKVENKDHVLYLLNSIICKINPYGNKKFFSKTDNITLWVKYDGYVWEIIDTIQNKLAISSDNCRYDNDDWNRDRNELIYRLSLLLKLDWERSKQEIAGNVFKRLSYALILVIEICTLFFLKEIIFKIITEPIEKNWYNILFFIVILIYPICFRIFSLESEFKNIQIFLMILMTFLPYGYINMLYYSLKKTFFIGLFESGFLVLMNLFLLFFCACQVGISHGSVVSYFKETEKSKWFRKINFFK